MTVERLCIACGAPHVGRPEDLYCPEDGEVLVAPEALTKRHGAPLLGKVLLNKYVINDILGRGGCAAVYKAWHIGLGVPVAFKALLPEKSSVQQRQRFQQEARLVARIKSPYVVRVSDFGALPDGSQYMVMDWVPGKPMTGLFSARPRPDVRRMVGLLQQILLALEGVHAKGLVHRDLKPGNVMVSKVDGRDRVTLIDFGIAKGDTGLVSGDQPRTMDEAMLGTPRYMAPEQFREASTVTERADIYAAGIMLFEILTGRPPFLRSDVYSMGVAHIQDAPPPLPKWVPASLREVVDRALAKAPEDRHASARAMADMLTAAGPLDARPMPLPEGEDEQVPAWTAMGTTAHSVGEISSAGSPDRNARRQWVLIGALLVFVLSGLGWLSLRGEPPSKRDSEAPIRIGLDTARIADAGESAAQDLGHVGIADAVASATDVGALDGAVELPVDAATRDPEDVGEADSASRSAHDADPDGVVDATPRSTGQSRRWRPRRRTPIAQPTPPAPPPGPSPREVARVHELLMSCRCAEAKRALQAMPRKPDDLVRRAAGCKVPRIDQSCVDGQVR